MGMYLAGVPYERCLTLGNNETLLERLRKVKRNEVGDLEWAKKKSRWLCEVSKGMKDHWVERHPDYEYDKEKYPEKV